MPPLQILYRDEHYIAVHKPAGLLVHRSAIDARETRFLVQLLRDQIGQHVYPIHRLDRPTQGVMVMALDAEAAHRMQEHWQTEAVDKTYLAVVRGFAPQALAVDHPLRDRPDSRIDRSELKTRAARTRLRRLTTIELAIAVGRYPSARYSLVECHPETGRRHQIRRHMKHLRHPIVGDAVYGDGSHNRMWRDSLNLGGLMLAATRLAFRHPYSQAEVVVSSPPEAPLQAALQLPGWSTDTAAPTHASSGRSAPV